MNKFLLPNIWHNYFISCDNKLLSNDLIKEMLNKFWNEIINNIDNKMVILLFRIQYEDKSFRTIGNLQKIDKSQFSSLYRLLTDLLSILSNDYKTLPIINVVFSYKLLIQKINHLKLILTILRRILYQHLNFMVIIYL